MRFALQFVYFLFQRRKAIWVIQRKQNQARNCPDLPLCFSNSFLS